MLTYLFSYIICVCAYVFYLGAVWHISKFFFVFHILLQSHFSEAGQSLVPDRGLSFMRPQHQVLFLFLRTMS